MDILSKKYLNNVPFIIIATGHLLYLYSGNEKL